MARLDRLAPVKEVAQVAAVIGREFAHELLAAVAPLREAELRAAPRPARRGRAGLPPRRAAGGGLHLQARAGAGRGLREPAQDPAAAAARPDRRCLEERFPETAEPEPELLAHHCTEAGLAEKAVGYWLKAGQQAARRSANVEAIEALRRGLAVVEQLPEGADGDEKELSLQLALGPVLMAAKGLVEADVGTAYRRARALCKTVGAADQLWPVVFGLWRFHLVRGEIQMSIGRAHELSVLAEQQPCVSIPALWAEGATRFWAGEPEKAQPYLERALEKYDPARHHALTNRCMCDPGVVCGAFLAWTLWVRGHPDHAACAAERAMSLAQTLAHPHSVVWAACFSAKLRYFLGDLPAAVSQSKRVIALADELVLPHHADHGRAILGWMLVEERQTVEGEHLLRQSLGMMLARGSRILQHWCLAGLAEASRLSGDASMALDRITQALEAIDETGARWWEPELHRLKGELLVSNETAAQASFEQAIKVARWQDAKSLELRATTSLARLWAEHRERQKAHHLLSSIYGWFTEGFDTADLRDARMLLDELR